MHHSARLLISSPYELSSFIRSLAAGGAIHMPDMLTQFSSHVQSEQEGG